MSRLCCDNMLCLLVMAAVFLSLSRPALAFQPVRHMAAASRACLEREIASVQTAKQSSRVSFVTRNVAANDDNESIPSDAKLIDLAKEFIRNKNSAGSGETTLDPVFDMCSSLVDLYGLTGDDVRPGFISFFEKHKNLHHELMEDPTVVGPGVVQYPFVKRWIDDATGEDQEWMSIDKPRNRFDFQFREFVCRQRALST